MKATLALATFCLLLTFSTFAQPQNPADHATMDHSKCPMMAAMSQHGGDHNHDAMNARGDKAMGFSQEKTTHHFRLFADGGAIEVTANDRKDSATLSQVRDHLQHIAHAFTAGDFSIPNEVHAEMPEGAAAMKDLASQIRYKYESLATGGRVRLVTNDAKALAAIHDFLRYQIREHKTGDPVDVRQ